MPHAPGERARRAVTDERVRIAREMHDVVAHHMSVISVQAGLARYVGQSDPVTTGTALDTVLRASGEALQEMRRMLTVLRIGTDEVEDGHETYRPAPGLDRLDDLVDRVRAAGVAAEVVVLGTPRPLDAGLDLCAYRVVQECLTNVLRHAGPAAATVTLRYDPDCFVARVSDDGRGPVEPPDDARPRHGLIGMRERASIYGGTVAAGGRRKAGSRSHLPYPRQRPGPEWPDRT